MTLWIGTELGRVERACLRSVIRQGHPVSLYCYEPPRGVPEGISVRDAAGVLPEELVVRHRATGSVSLFSNRFRYELQRAGAGVWVDADVYLLSPLPDERPYLFGSQGRGEIATAVLRMPADSPLLSDLISPFDERAVPWWLAPRPRAAAWWRLLRTGRTSIADMPWGSLGPVAVTAVARRHGVDHWALDPEVLSPVHWEDAAWVRDPNVALEAVTTARTVAVHVYNSLIDSFKDEPAPPGSFLARLHEEGAP